MKILSCCDSFPFFLLQCSCLSGFTLTSNMKIKASAMQDYRQEFPTVTAFPKATLDATGVALRRTQQPVILSLASTGPVLVMAQRGPSRSPSCATSLCHHLHPGLAPQPHQEVSPEANTTKPASKQTCLPSSNNTQSGSQVKHSRMDSSAAAGGTSC